MMHRCPKCNHMFVEYDGRWKAVKCYGTNCDWFVDKIMCEPTKEEWVDILAGKQVFISECQGCDEKAKLLGELVEAWAENKYTYKARKITYTVPHWKLYTLMKKAEELLGRKGTDELERD